MTTVELQWRRAVATTGSVIAPMRIWMLWVTAMIVTSCISAWVRTGELTGRALFNGWHNMDVEWYVNIAKYGYESPEPGGHYAYGKPAFFPLMPALMRLLHGVVGDYVLAGMIVSVGASVIATYLLWRLVRELTDDRTAGLSTALLFFSPFGLYFFVPYTESLFLALMLGTFLSMRSQRWAVAGILASLAAVTRVTGVLLIAAVAVEWIVQRRRASLGGVGPKPTVAAGLSAVLPPVCTFAAWEGYLWSVTGHWNSFSYAEMAVWLRDVVDPLTALLSTIRTTIDFTGSWFQYYWVSEIFSVLFGFVLAYKLARRGYWSWATFVGLNAFVLSLSSRYGSSSRALLTWFPAFILLAMWLHSKPRVRVAYFAICGPLVIVFMTSFTYGNWVA